MARILIVEDNEINRDMAKIESEACELSSEPNSEVCRRAGRLLQFVR